ncbi:MAG: shikimate kinase [Firmicutes bacterium]|nr:shikimate kinase [Bacillota bacterium]
MIGMPGAGKTTIGKMLYERLELKFVDVDEFIVEESGKTIPELFDVSESHFRNAESEAVKKLSMDKSSIIATGGGVIKNKANIEELKKNGIIVFIDRPLGNIAGDVEISKRPLLKDGVKKLYDLYDERYELYKRYSDFRVVNDGSIEAVVEKIIEKYAFS